MHSCRCRGIPSVAGDASPTPEGSWRLASHPGVAGTAYLPSLEGSASLWPFGTKGSSSHCAGMPCQPLGGGTSQLLCSTRVLVACASVAGMVLRVVECVEVTE
jgi:hypothetical protein